MADVVKTTIFYADVEDFGRLNEVYARHMPDPPPARSAPANVRLPRGLLVSIEAIAVLRADRGTCSPPKGVLRDIESILRQEWLPPGWGMSLGAALGRRPRVAV